jgi:hypothetical protein
MKEIRFYDEAVLLMVLFISAGAASPVVWKDGKDFVLEYFGVHTIIWNANFKKSVKNFFKAFAAAEGIFTA